MSLGALKVRVTTHVGGHGGGTGAELVKAVAAVPKP